MEKSGNFTSSLGSVLALAGSAVGLGNIWRFPYMVSQYGGGAFILVYIVCIIVVSLPIMLSEFIVGRRSRKGAYGAVAALVPEGPWKSFGALAVFIPFATLCYYCVIGGWTLDYFLKSVSMQFSPSVSPEMIEGMFGGLVTDTLKPLLFDLVFLLATALIIMLGVRKGIENGSKIMMPLLFFIMLGIAVRVVMLPGAAEGVRYLFYPDFSKITPEVCLAAMGQSFYSLSIGMGIMITYSSYLKRDSSLTRTAVCTITSDFIFAIISACAIIPILFAFGMPTQQGTGLVFKTLPVVFSQMPLGSLLAAVFFFAVILAALTSAMSLFEVPVGWLIDSCGMSRKKACAVVFAATFAVGAVCSLSFGKLSGLTVGGKIIFDALDYTIGNYLMPFAGLVIVLFVGWKMKREDKLDEFYGGEANLSRRKLTWFNVIDFCIRYVSPAAIIAIFLSGIL